MQIKQVAATGVRNIQQFHHEFCRGINLLVGANGSGKTSFLEVVHLLGMCKSFRCSNYEALINFSAESFVVSALLEGPDGDRVRLGFSRSKDGTRELKLANKKASISDVAKLVPLHLIDINTQYLVNGDAKLRREYLDWLLFHVEPSFLGLWRTLNKCLAQRNALLKAAFSSKGLAKRLEAWDNILVEVSDKISVLRHGLFSELLPDISEAVFTWLGINVTADYVQGWPKGATLRESLDLTIERDFTRGFTSVGPQRADISFKCDGHNARMVLSRGQQKMLAAALIIARANCLRAKTKKSGVFLVDDIAAELDTNSRARIFEAFAKLESQVFVTNIDLADVKDFIVDFEHLVFHVEQGVISAAASECTTSVAVVV